MKKYKQIIISGAVGFDEIMDFPGKFVDHFHPEKLHQINISFVVDKLEKELGGTGNNIAYNISLLTKKLNTLLAGVGRDSELFINFYKKNKINIKGILIDKNLYTATGKVITDIKDNQIWGFYYGACINGKNIKLHDYLTGKDLLIITANHPEAFLVHQNEAIKLKVNYMYDPGMALTWINNSDLIKGILNCKWLVGNDYEIAQILKRTGLKEKGILQKNIAIITTLGEMGVCYQDKKSKLIVPALKVKKVIDPTGAGDAWRGGFVSGIVENKPLIDCLKLGNVMASFAIEKYGTVNHHPSLKDVNKRLKII